MQVREIQQRPLTGTDNVRRSSPRPPARKSSLGGFPAAALVIPPHLLDSRTARSVHNLLIIADDKRVIAANTLTEWGQRGRLPERGGTKLTSNLPLRPHVCLHRHRDRLLLPLQTSA